MNFKEFTGQVQHRLEADSQGRAVRATRAVLTTLGDRLDAGGASDVASPLPMEIDRYVVEGDHGQRFDYQEFLERVVERANNEDIPYNFGKSGEMEMADADFASKAIVALVVDQLPAGQESHLEGQLPDDYDDLFEFVHADQTPWEEIE
ncbi:DUF2267 domain-containing protein [Haloparvum sp. PAK95]|uniref:DUF2267 domain-containing protein n=1 Tax=Haloparvum sp. PAK95 TaxID=3418962 RepID=UPI003D2F08C1